MEDLSVRGANCPHCGKSLEALSGAAFCPYCGGAVSGAKGAAERESDATRALLRKVAETTDPRKKHELLLEAERESPDSLGVAQELLFLGRLYERGGKNVDFSIIKCFLLMRYLEPEQFTEARKDELREELFAHPQLKKCLSLCGDENAFLRTYLLRMAEEFISLFLRGDSRYMRRIFGFGLDSRAPKLLAGPVGDMMVNIREDGKLSQKQRDMLIQTLYQAFSRDMGGDTQWLNEKLKRVGISVPDIV